MVMAGGRQLHRSCTVATRPLRHSLPRYGKKWFKQKGLYCNFCNKDGHEVSFCPSLPNRPPKRERVLFVERLLQTPKVNTNKFIKMTLEEAWMVVKEQGGELNEGNPWVDSKFIYDRLRARLGYWKAIGADKSVLSWLAYGIPMRFKSEPPHKAYPNHRMDKAQEEHTDEDIAKHVGTGCFVEADQHTVKCANPILGLSQGGKFRRCDDCRSLNAYLANPKFKMASLKRDIPLVIGEEEVQISEDLEKAYYKILLAKAARVYLAFEWKGKYYIPKVMLFGMCQAPFYFTKIVRPIARLFGALRVPSMSFIDDWLWSVGRLVLDEVRGFIRDLFETLGWSFNKKGQEGTRVKFLGFIIDTVARVFVAPHERVTGIKEALEETRLLANSGLTITSESLESLLGRVVSVSLAIPAVRLWCRALYGSLTREGQGIIMSGEALEELGVLSLLLTFHNGTPFLDPIHDVQMWVDSGEVGWGASIDGVEVMGQFPAAVIGSSSTRREIRGLRMSLESKEGAQIVEGKVVRVTMDSMCAVRNILKGGGPVEALVMETKELWRTCQRGNIQLKPEWETRGSVGMRRVDALSKTGTEWVLQQAFVEGVRGALGVDPWAPDLARCGPVVVATIARKVKAVLVLPRWEAQPWWPVAMTYCTGWANAPRQDAVFVPNCQGYPQWDFCLVSFGC